MSTQYLFHYDPTTGEYNDSLNGDYLWSSVNIREAAPDVMTPYTWSRMRTGYARMILLPGFLQVGNICGRIYFNVSVQATVYKAIWQRHAFDDESRELFGIDPDELVKWNISLVPISLRDRVLILHNGLRFQANIRNSMQSIQAFIDTNSTWCEAQLDTLPVLEKDGLVHWSNDVLRPYLVRYFWCVMGSVIFQTTLVGKLRRDLVQITSADDTIALLSNVSTEDEFLSSLGIVANLDKLRRGKLSREGYLKKHGHRGPHEAEMSIPRSAEDPNWINEQLEGLERAPVEVETLLQEQRARYQAALKNLQKVAPKEFDSFQTRIKEAAHLTRLREGARSEYIRNFGVMRAFVLRAGALCDLGADAFFLEHDEILQLLGGQAEAISQIPIRKTAFQMFSALPDYPTIIVGRFDPFTWAADPNRRTDIYDANHRISRLFADQVKGLPGSAGQAQGRVRIVNSPEEGCQLQSGEILVAVTTNVGWTPIFPRAAAVVTDVGAPLSHAAIVAREMGIPAVVGCGNATMLLKTGDFVRVDGGRGIVEILNG